MSTIASDRLGVSGAPSNGEGNGHGLSTLDIVRRLLRPEVPLVVAERLAGLLAGVENSIPALLEETKIADQVITHHGIPFLRRDVPVNVKVLQDCGGAETISRSDAHFGDVRPLGPTGIRHEQMPPLSPASIGATLASIIGEHVYARHLAGHEPFMLGDTPSAFLDTPMVIIANSAPRSSHNPGKVGAPFVFARLGFNIFYFGTNSIELGFVKDHINGEVRAIPITEEATYRSKRLPQRFSRWREFDASIFAEVQNIESFPKPQSGVLLIADNFGNVKTSIRKNDPEFVQLEMGSRVFVTMNGLTGVAHVVPKLQEGHDGKLVITPGSSRHDTVQIDNRQVDLFVVNGRKDNVVSRFFGELQRDWQLPCELVPVAETPFVINRVVTPQHHELADMIERNKTMPSQGLALV